MSERHAQEEDTRKKTRARRGETEDAADRERSIADQDKAEEARKGGMAYAAAFALFSSVVICLGLGWLLDRWLGTKPWLLVVGIVLGSILGLYEFVRITNKIAE
jgi:ATP synthase protein I